MPILRRPLFRLSLALPAITLAPLASADLPPATAYHSYARPEDAGDMRTLIRTFRHPKSGETIVFFGAIHLADESFYDRFNAEIRKADLTLFEGVSGSPGLGTLPLVYQSGIAQRLVSPTRLASQREMVITTAPGCENADVDIGELSPGWGSTLGGIVMLPVAIVIGETVVLVQSTGDVAARATGNGGAYAHWHRDLLASQLNKAEPGDMPDSELILDKRNAVVLDHVDRARRRPNAPRRILIPWGAAHGPGIEKGLRERGFEAISDEWVKAVGVKSFKQSGYTTPAHPYHFHLPLIFSIRGSDTTLTHSGPLWIWHHTSAPAGSDSSAGWLLFTDFSATGGDSGTTLLGGLLYLSQNKRETSESLWLLGALRYTESNAVQNTRYSHQLLGLHARESSPEHTRVRLGWWGSIFDHTQKSSGDQTTSVLPHLFGRPILYDSVTKAGETRRRFLLFFEI